jgi:hypothetical protein
MYSAVLTRGRVDPAGRERSAEVDALSKTIGDNLMCEPGPVLLLLLLLLPTPRERRLDLDAFTNAEPRRAFNSWACLRDELFLRRLRSCDLAAAACIWSIAAETGRGREFGPPNFIGSRP